MVFAFTIFYWTFVLLNTSTMLPCRLSHKGDWPFTAKLNLNPRASLSAPDNEAVFSETYLLFILPVMSADGCCFRVRNSTFKEKTKQGSSRFRGRLRTEQVSIYREKSLPCFILSSKLHLA